MQSFTKIAVCLFLVMVSCTPFCILARLHNKKNAMEKKTFTKSNKTLYLKLRPNLKRNHLKGLYCVCFVLFSLFRLLKLNAVLNCMTGSCTKLKGCCCKLSRKKRNLSHLKNMKCVQPRHFTLVLRLLKIRTCIIYI